MMMMMVAVVVLLLEILLFHVENLLLLFHFAIHLGASFDVPGLRLRANCLRL